MKYKPKYRPFRIVSAIMVEATIDILKKHYPNAKIGRGTNGKAFGLYRRMLVVNVPSEFELALFLNHSQVKEIEQDPRGFDKPEAGYARGTKSSEKAKKDSATEVAKERFRISEEEKRAASEAKKKEARAPKMAPEPEQESESKPEIEEEIKEPAKTKSESEPPIREGSASIKKSKKKRGRINE